MEFMGPTLLCLDIIDPGALGGAADHPHNRLKLGPSQVLYFS